MKHWNMDWYTNGIWGHAEEGYYLYQNIYKLHAFFNILSLSIYRLGATEYGTVECESME